MLLEFSSKRSQKPQKILDLSLYSLRLADELCGSPYSFCLYLNQKDFQYYAAETKGDLASWVSCCHFYCKEDFNLLWKPDDVLEAINDAVVVCSDNGVSFLFILFFFLLLCFVIDSKNDSSGDNWGE